MKRAVLRANLHAQERCVQCGLLGVDALRGEQEAANAQHIARHPICDHIMWWRNPPIPAETIGALWKVRRRGVLDRTAQYNLTMRDMDLAQLLLDDHDNQKIAESMGVSQQCIAGYVYRLANKLDIPKGQARRYRLTEKLRRVMA